MRAVLGCKPAVVDRLGAVIGSLRAAQGGLRTFVCHAPAITGGAIPCGPIEITRRVVTRFGLPVSQPGRDITVLSRHPGLATAHACQLVRPGIGAVLGSLGTVFGRNLAVVDGLGAVVRGTSASPGGLVTFVCRIFPVGRGAIAGGSVKIACRVITCLGLTVTQAGGDVSVRRSLAGLAAPNSCQLVGPGIFTVLGGVGTIFGRNLAVVDGLGAVVRGTSASPGGLVTFVCRIFPVGRGAIAGGSVKIACRVITCLGLTVTQAGGDVSVRRSLAGLAAPNSCQLVGPGIFTVLGGVGTIFGRNLAVVDRLGTIVRSLGAARRRPRAFALGLMTLRVVARRGLSVTLLRFSVAHIRGQIAVAPFDVALAGRGQSVEVLIRQSVPAWADRRNNCSNRLCLDAHSGANGPIPAD